MSSTATPLESPNPSEATPVEVEVEKDVRRCSQCSTRMAMETQVCGDCGYYETIGKFVELEEQEEVEEKTFPFWVFVVIPVACLLVVGESLAVAHFTHIQSPDRRMFSLAHLIAGSLLFLVPHLRAQFLSYKADNSRGLGDFLFHPVQIWGGVLKKLPKSFPWVLAAAVGLTSVLCSLIIIRGLPSPFQKIDIGGESIKDVTIATVKRGADADSLTEALENGPNVNVVSVDPEEEEKAREYLDCVIVGYNVSELDSRRVISVVVASEINGQLQVLGNVTKGIPELQQIELGRKFRRFNTNKPILSSHVEAQWLQPKFYCRIWCHESEEGERYDFNFDRMMFLK